MVTSNLRTVSSSNDYNRHDKGDSDGKSWNNWLNAIVFNDDEKEVEVSIYNNTKNASVLQVGADG